MLETEQQVDLFGTSIDRFKNAKERYGVWPTTVWEVDHSDRMHLQLKELVGDDGRVRGESGQGGLSSGKGVWQPKVLADGTQSSTIVSIFSPAVASWVLNMYAPTAGVYFDPFAGGGTRAIMAAKHGLHYTGVELREDEAEAVRRRCAAAGVEELVKIHTGDARFCETQESRSADFLLTCPPYFSMEEYGGGKGDLSMLDSYSDFLVEMNCVVAHCARIMRAGSTSVWVVGMMRDTDGTLRPLHHDITRLHLRGGFRLREEVILAQKNNGAIQRIGNFDKGNRWLVRTHEYALVFTR